MEDLRITHERWSVVDLKNSAGALFAEKSSDVNVHFATSVWTAKNRQVEKSFNSFPDSRSFGVFTPVIYLDLGFNIATSKICEKVFLVAVYALGELCKCILLANFECQLFLHVEYQLWELQEVDAIVRWSLSVFLYVFLEKIRFIIIFRGLH